MQFEQNKVRVCLPDQLTGDLGGFTRRLPGLEEGDGVYSSSFFIDLSYFQIFCWRLVIAAESSFEGRFLFRRSALWRQVKSSQESLPGKLLEQAPSRGHEAHSQSGLGVG